MRMALNAYRNEMNGNSRQNGGRMEYGEMRGDEVRYGEMRRTEMRMNDMRRMPFDEMDTGVESRRRRDGRGRFMEYDSPMYAQYDREDMEYKKEYKPERYEQKPDPNDQKQSNVIGFKGKQQEHRKQSGGSLDFEKAKKWVEKMGEHFSFDKSKAIMQRVDAMDCNPIEFWAILNSIHSDYGEVLEKYNIALPEVYGALTKAWLKDEDAVSNKVIEYLECIVQK